MKKITPLFLLVSLLAACEAPAVNPEPVEEIPNEEVTVPLEIALIAMEDNGSNGPLVGCGDSIVLVEKGEATNASEAFTVKAALNQLFGIDGQNYGESGLYNALYQSDITIENVSVVDDSVSVELSGSITSGGVCDDPRIEEQVFQTIRANTDATYDIHVTINGKDLNTYFNQSGQ